MRQIFPPMTIRESVGGIMKKLIVFFCFSLSLSSLATLVDCRDENAHNVVANRLPGIWEFDREMSDRFGVDFWGNEGDTLTLEKSDVALDKFLASSNIEDEECVYQMGMMALNSEEGETKKRPFILVDRGGMMSLMVLNTTGPLNETQIYMIPGANMELDILALRENLNGVAPSIFKRKNS